MKDYPFYNKSGKKRPQAKEWAGVRAELMQLKAQFNLSDIEFRALSPYEDHQGIEEKIYQTFCIIADGRSRPEWLWQSLKTDKYTTNIMPRPECYLHELIDNEETIWLGAVATLRESSKIWLFEGKILPIQTLISETHYFDEFYFVSKKYEWLICINHHDALIATGSDMPNKLKSLHNKLESNSIAHKSYT